MYNLIKRSISTIVLTTLAITSLPTHSASSQTTAEYSAKKYNIESTKNIATEPFNLVQSLSAPMLEKENVEILSGTVFDLTKEAAATSILSMTEGTIIIKFKSNSNNQYQSLFSVSNSTTGNQDRHFHIYMTPDGSLGMELRNTDADFKYTMNVPNVLSVGKENIIAFKGDKISKEYKLFANGKLVSTISKNNFKFFNDILGADNISLGGTIRQKNIAYPFVGTINKLSIYNLNLTDNELIEATNNSSIPSGLIIEKNNINITEGKGYDLSQEVGAEYVKALEKGTILVSYKSTSSNSVQSLISIGNGTSGNRDRHFHIYITNTGEVGMELRNTDSVLKYTLGRPAAVRSIYKNNLVFNTIALKADPSTKQYKIFANGELLATLSVDVYKFINDITGVNNIMLGGTLRDGVIAYPFGGTIGSVKIYNEILTDDVLKNETGITSYGKNIFYAGDSTKSNYFRIPSLLSLSSGTVVSAADARYGGTHDSKSNIDIAFSKSKDGGITWLNPTIPLQFNDYVAKNIEWPRDSVGKNVQIQGSASFIDPVLLEDKETKRLFIFADAMPAGIGSSNASTGSGYKDIAGKKYMKLRWHQDGSSTYNYSIRENGVIYNDVTNLPTEYKIDGEYNLYKNGVALFCKQYDYNFSGTTLLETATNVDVNMNVFYKDSLFKVFPTTYLAMKYSDDEGETWSNLNIVSSFKPENSKFLVLGPGVGKQISKGQYKGRLIVPVYSSSYAELGFMYSDDHGSSWNYVAADNRNTGSTAEAQIVEMPDGSLKSYLRTGSGVIAEVTSINGGETWSERVTVPNMHTTSYGTQLSVINYSGLIDGKEAIILSAPDSTSARGNGKIWIGLINDTGNSGVNKYTVEWKYCYSVDSANMGYSYSCLTELPNGDIGLLYEKYDSWSRNELHLKNILKYETFSINELKQPISN
ncbi:sialidase domain-containing protein [uncultured Clostridium sp.]|uniref:sialidase domain-containing protein n=1 Tax=uncultured Clostridium sp. TaxID=59620 RepID=UPI002586F148|nr:sialidase domain-containing protein [uncultured Clostridium sp.]